jgi:hypothetical protein
MYIDVKDTSIGRDEVISDLESENPPFNTSYTIRCRAATTRGYFELGNDFNNNTYGPLLEQWPNKAQMAEIFNDWTDTGAEEPEPYIPSEMYVR